MKQITLYLFLFTIAKGMSQNLPVDFSDPLDQFSPAGSTMNIIPEPGMPSNMVGQIIGGGGQYDNLQLVLTNYISLTGTNKTITFRFFNPDADVMPGLLQLTGSSNGSPAVEVPFTSNVNGAWQTVTLNFANATNAFPFCAGCPQATPVALDKYSTIILFTDFAVFTQDTYLIDDIAGAQDGGPVAVAGTPSTAATSPTAPANQVISMFSNAYTNVAVDTWRTSWSQSALQDTQIAGNDVKKYTALSFNGVETIATPINATAANMNFFNLDIWTPNATEVRIKLVDFKGDGFQGAAGDTEAELAFPLTANAWQTLQIPLSSFTAAGMTAFTNINQLIVSANPSGSAILYVDNVYYSQNATASTADFKLSKLSAFPNPSNQLYWNVTSSIDAINTIDIYSLIGQKVASLQSDSTILRIDNSTFENGIYIAVVKTDTGSQNIKLIKY